MNAAGIFDQDCVELQKDVAASNEPRPGGTLSFVFVCLFIVAIYARPEDVFPIVAQVHLTFLLGMCAGAFFLWSLLFGDVSLFWSRELQLILFLTAWFTAGVPFAYWRGGSLQVLTETWLKTVLIFSLLTQTLVTLKRVRTVLWAIILSELTVTVYSLAAPSQLTLGCVGCGAGRGSGERMIGVSNGFLYWNLVGIALGMIIPYMAALFIERPSALRSTLLAATAVSMMWMQVLTASRSGTVVAVFAVILTSLLVCRGSPRGKVVRWGTMIALLVTICLAPSVFWERVATIVDDSAPANAVEASAVVSKDDHLQLLTRSVTFTIEHPFFGLGLGNFAVANGNELQEAEAWLGTHNTFTQISSEAGIPALLLFLALLITVLRGMKRVMRLTEDPQSVELNLMARATLVSLLSFMLGAFFAHKGYDYYVYTGPIAVAVGVQRIAVARQKAFASVDPSLASQPQDLSRGWTL
jgi:O-antigen ligase